MNTAQSIPPTINAITTPSLSPHRAFVVHFHAATAQDGSPTAGRIEHITSGTVAHFGAWSELIAFVTRYCA